MADAIAAAGLSAAQRMPLGPVRISMPASVAYDLDKFEKGIGDLVARLGCGRCFSGADCYFHMVREFIIDEKLQAMPHVNASLNAESFAGRHVPQTVTVALPDAVGYKLENVHKAIRDVVGKLGPCPCTSGFDILFTKTLEGINFAADVKGQIHDLGRF